MEDTNTMDYIYSQIDQGRSVKSLAIEMGVASRTLYRWHENYQKRTGGTRKSLTAGRGAKKKIDMDLVYKKLNEGQTVSAIAKELDVCTRTIYRHASMLEENETDRIRRDHI